MIPSLSRTPENEYGPLVKRFGKQGQVIDLSPTSSNYINPLDINLDYSDDENPITLKSDFVLSLCDLIIGGKDGLTPIEKTIIDRCTRLVYRDYLQDPRPENMPSWGICMNCFASRASRRPRISPLPLKSMSTAA